MEFIAIGIMVVLALVAGLFFRENGNLHKRVVSLDEQLREAQHAKSKTSKPSKSEKAEKAVAVDPELERDLDDARGEIKDLKKQVYDLKTESKGLKQQLKDATADRTSSAPDSEMIFELREQIAELTTENARLEDEVEEAKTRRPAPKPEKKEKKPEPPPAAVASASAGADTESLRAKYGKEIDELRDEVRDLNRKLKSTASNVDKQRRRADNNDRAYKITQRQYDAAQERVSLLEAQLDQAGIDPVPVAELKARTPEVSSEPAVRTPAAIAADEAAAKAAKAAEEAAAEAATAEISRAPSPATPQKKEEPPKKEAPKPPPTPGAKVRKPANKPKPEVGSTTVLSPMALASASAQGADEEEEETEQEGDTVHRAKPITAADLSGSIPKPKIKPPAPKKRDSEDFDSGGHTAMLTPGALAKSSPAEEKSEPTADESGGHTAVLSSVNLGKAVTGSDEKPAADEEKPAADESGGHTAVLSSVNLGKAVTGDQETSEPEDSEARETGEQTAILSAAAFASTEGDDESEAAEEAKPKVESENEGGRRPSSGLFGMPDDVFKKPEDEQDPIRSTQFAFPTQMANEDDDDTGGTAKFAPVTGSDLKPSRLGGSVKDGDNPADKPVPDADEDDGDKKENRLGGGRLGDLDLGDIGSAIDDAWGDIDID